MPRPGALLFGLIMPVIEVLLVVVGLGMMGWEGVIYTLTGQWNTIRLATLGAAGLVPHWGGGAAGIRHLPVPGDRVVLRDAAGLFTSVSHQVQRHRRQPCRHQRRQPVAIRLRHQFHDRTSHQPAACGSAVQQVQHVLI